MNLQLRVLVVDDEPVARKVLREELGLFPDIVVVGEADNGREALAQISLPRQPAAKSATPSYSLW